MDLSVCQAETGFSLDELVEKLVFARFYPATRGRGDLGYFAKCCGAGGFVDKKKADLMSAAARLVAGAGIEPTTFRL